MSTPSTPASKTTTAAVSTGKRKKPASKSTQKKAKKQKVETKRAVVRVEKHVPESNVFTRLVELEQHLDHVLSRKHHELTEAFQRPAPLHQRKLRVTVWNTYDSQSGFYHNDELAQVSVADAANWTIRIEGHVMDEERAVEGGESEGAAKAAVAKEKGTRGRRFSSYLRKLYIQLDESGATRDSVEWHRSQTPTETDGFEVKRTGAMPQEIAIFLHLAYSPPRLKLSPALSKALGMTLETRSRVLVSLWHYIKNNKLQDPEDRKQIHLDDDLQAVFGCPTIAITALPNLLHEHLTPPEPIKITFKPSLTADPASNAKTFDITVYDDHQRSGAKLVAQQELDALEDKILRNIAEINESRKVHDFMTTLAESPVECLTAVLASEARHHAVSNTAAKKEIQQRTSDLYFHPLVPNAVNAYLQRQESAISQTTRT